MYVYMQTDHMSYLLSLDRWRISTKLRLECHQCITETAEGNGLTLSRIKGHENSKGHHIWGYEFPVPRLSTNLNLPVTMDLIKEHTDKKFLVRWEERTHFPASYWRTLWIMQRNEAKTRQNICELVTVIYVSTFWKWRDSRAWTLLLLPIL